MPFLDHDITLEDFGPPDYLYALGVRRVAAGEEYGEVFELGERFRYGDFVIDMLSFVIAGSGPEPDPDPGDRCCPPLPAPPDREARCAPLTVYGGSPCHVPECAAPWDGGRTRWDGGDTRWECEEVVECAAEVVGIGEVGALDFYNRSLTVEDPDSADDTTTLLVALTTWDAVEYRDFTMPDGWGAALPSGDPWEALDAPDPLTEDYVFAVVWRYDGVVPPEVAGLEYEFARVRFMRLTLRLPPGSRLAGFGVASSHVASEGHGVGPEGGALASGQLVMGAMQSLVRYSSD